MDVVLRRIRRGLSGVLAAQGADAAVDETRDTTSLLLQEKTDVSNQNFSTDLDDLLRQLESVGEATGAASQPRCPVRLVVATDWSNAAAPLAVLKAFRVIAPRDSPLQLAFAVPHTPGVEDAECVHALLEGADAAGELDGIEVLPFDEVVEQPYDAAVVPTGEPDLLLTEVAGLIVRMYDIVRRMERARDEGRLLGEDVTVNVGSRPRLRRRLESFSA